MNVGKIVEGLSDSSTKTLLYHHLFPYLKHYDFLSFCALFHLSVSFIAVYVFDVLMNRELINIGVDSMAVENGNKVKIEYTGTLDDGTVFDSTEKHGGEPLEFEVGTKQVIKGFEDAVIGMEKDQEKEVSLKPSEAYGDHNPQLIKKVPLDKMPQGQELKPGMMLGVQMSNGQQVPAKITEVTDTEVTIDMNHPLVGQNLNFKIKVVSVE